MIARLIQTLKDAQAQHAHGALSQPRGADAFEYGRAVGIYGGLTMALGLIDQLLADEKHKDFD